MKARELNADGRAVHEDIDDYISTFDDRERQELAAADAAIDIAILLHRARTHRGLSQTAAAKRAGLQQQAISRLEQPDANPRLATMQLYLRALGYSLELRAVDLEKVKSTARSSISSKLRTPGQPRRGKTVVRRRAAA